MADHFPGRISIGGRIARRDFVRMFNVATSEGLGLEWGDASSMPETPRELLAAVKAGQPLELCDDQARYGTFEGLEQFCFQTGIAYRRHSDARDEHDGEVAWWVPGMERPNSTTARQDGTPTLCARTLRQLLDEPGAAEEKLAKVAAYVRDNSPPEMPALEVIEDGLAWEDWQADGDGEGDEDEEAHA